MIMSKSLANDALLTAIDGGNVAIFGDSAGQTSVVMRWFRNEYPELEVVAEFTHDFGRSYMTFPGGGTLSFLSKKTNLNQLRGWRLDRCYVPIETRRQFLDDHIRPCLVTSSDGTLAGY